MPVVTTSPSRSVDPAWPAAVRRQRGAARRWHHGARRRSAGGQSRPGLRRFAALDRARTGRTADAIFDINTAQTWLDFREAARLFEVPAQNLVYADVEEHIGYQSPGRIPIRPSGPGRPLGRWPAAGWSNEDEWLGYIPFEELPSTYDPPEGYIVTANNAVAAPTYPNYLTDEWAYGYRSQRIVERIEELDNGIDIDAMTDIQRDTRNGNAAYLVPMLLDVQLDPWEREAQDLLRDWDYRQPPLRSRCVLQRGLEEPAVHHLRRRAAGGHPSRRWRPLVRGRSAADGRARQRLVGQRHDERRARDARHRSAAGAGRCTRRDDAASGQGSARVDVGMGARVGGPQRHLRHVRHRPDRVALQPWAATPWRRPLHRGCRRLECRRELHEVNWVPSMRMVVDLDDLDRSRWINLTGASGHAFHRHYFDQAGLWGDGRTTTWPWTADAVEGAAENTLVLTPSSS